MQNWTWNIWFWSQCLSDVQRVREDPSCAAHIHGCLWESVRRQVWYQQIPVPDHRWEDIVFSLCLAPRTEGQWHKTPFSRVQLITAASRKWLIAFQWQALFYDLLFPAWVLLTLEPAFESTTVTMFRPLTSCRNTARSEKSWLHVAKQPLFCLQLWGDIFECCWGIYIRFVWLRLRDCDW